MASSSGTDYSDLVQAAKSGHKVQQLIADLSRYFSIEAIANKEGYSKVDCAYDESKVLGEVREEFKKEFVQSKKVVINPLVKTWVNAIQLTDIVQAIVSRPKKKYYLSYGVRLLAFQSGLSNLGELVVNKDDCIILIPVFIIGSATGTLEEEGTEEGATARRTTFTCEVGSELIMSGRCSINMQPESKAVCVVLTIGKDKE